MRKFFILLLVLSFQSFASGAKASEERTPGAIAALCAQGIEGIYLGQLGGKSFRFNLFCVEGERILTTFGEQSELVGVMVSLGQAAVDGDSLVLSTFKIAHDERQDISARNTLIYFRFDLAALAKGRLEGYYHGPNLDHFAKVSARRVQAFPKFDCGAEGRLGANKLRGAYAVQGSSFGKVTLLADILAGTPVLTLLIPDLEGRQAMAGPEWDGSGCFESYTAQGDWEPESRQMIFIRGQLLEGGKVRLFWVTYRGVEGPFFAIRKQGPPTP